MVGPQPNITIEQAVARLPPKNKMDPLISIYFRHHFIAAPYIHTSKFQEEYDGFWIDHSSASLLWISVLSSILWSAASLASLTGDNLSKSHNAVHLDNLAKLAEDCLVAGDYLAAKQYSIEALLLCASTDLQRKKQCTLQMWAQSRLLVRLAQRMGYHRDPRYLPNISPFEGELRRRAWFLIEVFDCISSFQLGIPPTIREDEYDTESPGHLHNLEFDGNSNVLPPSRTPTEPMSHLYMCIKSELCRKLCRVIIISMSLKPTPYEEVIRLHDEIDRYHDYIPQPFKIRPIRPRGSTGHIHGTIRRLTLEMMYLKSMCILHRTYLNIETDGRRYDISRRTSVSAAIRILHLHVEYEEDCRPSGRLYEDCYTLLSFGLYDYLIASMILCLDLLGNTHFSQQDRARNLRALGTSYKIWLENKTVSREAAHATKVVGAMLRHVLVHETSQTPLPLSHLEVRGGSRHVSSLLDNDNGLPPLSGMAPTDRSLLADVVGLPLDFLTSSPLDSVLINIGQYDWKVIDQYLLEKQE